MNQLISISKIASISALGSTSKEVWESYLLKKPLFSKTDFQKNSKSGSPSEVEEWVSKVSSETELKLQELQEENPAFRKLDRSVLLALLSSKDILSSTAFQDKNIGINIGSSRGATALFEDFHNQFLKGKPLSPLTSPTTTLGNISSWIGQYLEVQGIQIGHSVTCSTALHALLNGIAWLQADMADAFVVGGSEAALTPFTLAQMNALKLYSKAENIFPCESMRFQKTKNTMVLGEGAALALLEKGISERTQAVILGYGFASEKLESSSSISENADCFQKSMKMALQNAKLPTVDCIIMHAPGTVMGDMAEKNAIDLVFGQQLPLLTSNKFLVGHTFAASGMLSIEMAIMMLKYNKLIENPFYENARHLPNPLKTIMINAVGFGGNAVSIIISKP